MMQQQNKGAVGGRKLTSRRLATGQVSILLYVIMIIIITIIIDQHVALSVHDEKNLRNAYDYMAGYAARQKIEQPLQRKEEQIELLFNSLPPHVKVIINSIILEKKDDNDDININNDNKSNQAPKKMQLFKKKIGEIRQEDEAKVEEYYQIKDDIDLIEEKLKIYKLIDHKISLKDLEVLIKKLDTNLSKRTLEHMIWEVDEDTDSMIGWDELVLTYSRNLNDKDGNEPNLFFRILEFVAIDSHHKGYIIEDDCMEFLFARYGGSKLEKEMQTIFGKKLRVSGGDGTLDLTSYLNINTLKQGRRALLT